MDTKELAVAEGVVEVQGRVEDGGQVPQPVAGDELTGRRSQRGMVSAEWAVGIIAAVALAGVLIAVVTNGPVQDALLKFVLQVIKSFSSYIVG